MRAARAIGRLLEPVRRRPSLVVVVALLVSYAGPAAADRTPPAAAATGVAEVRERVATTDLPNPALLLRPPRQELPPAPAKAPSPSTRPWPARGGDTPDHLLAKAIEEIRRRDPGRYRAMRRKAPGWGISLCDRVLCRPDVQGQTLVTSDGECLTMIAPRATLRVARRHRLPGLLWVADVLVHEHGHCNNVRNEYSSIQAQRRFLDAWPAGPGRERARDYVDGLHRRLDATGNWRGR